MRGSFLQLLFVASLGLVQLARGQLHSAEQATTKQQAANQQQEPDSDTKNNTLEASLAEATVASFAPEPGEPLLSQFELSRRLYSPRLMDLSAQLFFQVDSFHGVATISELGSIALRIKLHACVYSDLFIHAYSSYKDLKLSGGPHVDQELCLAQLNEMIERARRVEQEKFATKDLNIFQLLDTFGRPPPGLILGNSVWPGQYHECKRLTIKARAGELPTRYCIASLRDRSWLQSNILEDLIAMKAAACLPRTCDSTNYKNKYDLVLTLLEFNASPIEKNVSQVTGLYCLPDDESPLAIWWHSPKTLAAVAALAAWILFLLYATLRCHHLDKRHERREEDDRGLKLSLSTGGFAVAKDKLEAGATSKAGDQRLKLYQALSITRNLGLLFDTSKASSLLQAADKLEAGKQAPPKVERPAFKVDLSCVEGIKVVAMCYIITGHVMMCLPISVNNGRELATSNSLSYTLSNLMPAFAVNAFFTITGLLTAYLMFKQNQTHAFISSPLKWFAFIVYRYLRIMPLYAIVVLYTKHVARFTGSGPFWDYGTSQLGARKWCEQESWLWTLLFGANLKSPLEHCIPSAWYLANDFQFFVVTPFFLALLHKSPKLGEVALKLGVVLSYISAFTSVYNSELEDLRPIANFMPHGFKTYVTYLHENYTRPQNRISAYLIGLLIGLRLHQFELKRSSSMEKKTANSDHTQQVEPRAAGQERPETKPGESDQTQQAHDWSELFKSKAGFYCLFNLILCLLTPSIGSRLPLTKWGARLLVAFIMPTNHVVIAVTVGFYILLATTGNGNRLITSFLSMKVWKPLARLSLCAVLINVEVISYLLQSRSQSRYVDNHYQASLNLMCILGTYFMSVVVCVLFEAPVRAALNHILSAGMSKVAVKKNKRE